MKPQQRCGAILPGVVSIEGARPGGEAARRRQTWRSPWPDWRDGDPGDLREQLGWPVEGALFDVEHNALWHPSWGQRPTGISQALSTARSTLPGHPR
jgi:hypothetical protein